MKNYGTFERYFVLEFYDDYRDGLIDGRALTRRVAFITGSMAAAAAAMAAVGCTRDEVPSADEPMPQAKAAAPTSRPTGQSTGESGRAGTARATVASVPGRAQRVFSFGRRSGHHGRRHTRYLGRPGDFRLPRSPGAGRSRAGNPGVS